MITIPRVLPIRTKMGGFLPCALVPIFAGLSAVSSLAGGASAIVNAMNEANRNGGPNTHLGNGPYLRSY